MNLPDFHQALKGCVRCGRCLPVCPVYGRTLWEGSSSRGKLSLLRAELEGEKDLAGRMKDLLSHCVQCGACAEVCSSGVRSDELIGTGRTLALSGGGLTRLKSLLTADLLGRGLAARGLWKARPLFLKNIPPESGLHFRFPVPGLDRERRLPRPAKRSFFEEGPPARPGPGSGPRVALFAGCVSNYLRPQAARAAFRLLEAAGARVFVPPDQVCCGKPAAGAGDAAAASTLARINLKALLADQADYVAAFCATCSEQLKHYAADPDLPRAGNLADKVIDLSPLLADVLKWRPRPPAGPAGGLKVFYHDPCHLRRKQGVYRQPRVLIDALPEVELVGSDLPPQCCGYGGIFNLWHYDLSRQIWGVRAESVSACRPDRIVTSCSGCWLQFHDFGSRTEGFPQTGLLVELLAERGL